MVTTLFIELVTKHFNKDIRLNEKSVLENSTYFEELEFSATSDELSHLLPE